MDEQRDGGFEVLDVRPARSWRRRSSPPRDGMVPHRTDQQPLHLDLGEAPEPDRRELPAWQRWAIAVVVFAAGLAVGGYGWHARSEAVDAARIDVIVTELSGEIFERGEAGDLTDVRIWAVLHNAGTREVGIVDLRLPAATERSQDSSREVTIPAGSDDRARVRGLPDCAAGQPTELEADVRTEAGLSTVTLSVPPGSSISFPLQAACPPAENAAEYGTSVYLGWTFAPGQAPPGNRMELAVYHEVRSEWITGVELAAEGFAAEPINLPVELAPTMTTVLELDWTVTDCAATHELGPVGVELTLADGSIVSAELPYEAVGHLATIAVAECGS